MPRISDSISILKVGGKTYKGTQWWNVEHQLTKAVKKEERLRSIKANGRYNISCQVHTKSDKTMAQQAAAMKADLDSRTYSEYAPWNPIYRLRSNTVVVFNK